MFRMDGFKRVLSVGVLALTPTTLVLGAPNAMAAPPLIGRMNLGFAIGHDSWHGERG